MAKLQKQLMAAKANATTDAEKLRTAYEAHERVDQQCANLQLEVEAKSLALSVSLKESAVLRNQLASQSGDASTQVGVFMCMVYLQWYVCQSNCITTSR